MYMRTYNIRQHKHAHIHKHLRALFEAFTCHSVPLYSCVVARAVLRDSSVIVAHVRIPVAQTQVCATGLRTYDLTRLRQVMRQVIGRSHLQARQDDDLTRLQMQTTARADALQSWGWVRGGGSC